jgi:hypothetical protein
MYGRGDEQLKPWHDQATTRDAETKKKFGVGLTVVDWNNANTLVFTNLTMVNGGYNKGSKGERQDGVR